MRILIFFDLPSISLEEKREYRKFRNFLINEGFLMLQESVYCKIALNQTSAKYIRENVYRHKPSVGLVQLMTITEKQYQAMEYIVGEKNSDVIDSDKKVILL